MVSFQAFGKSSITNGKRDAADRKIERFGLMSSWICVMLRSRRSKPFAPRYFGATGIIIREPLKIPGFRI